MQPRFNHLGDKLCFLLSRSPISIAPDPKFGRICVRRISNFLARRLKKSGGRRSDRTGRRRRRGCVAADRASAVGHRSRRSLGGWLRRRQLVVALVVDSVPVLLHLVFPSKLLSTLAALELFDVRVAETYERKIVSNHERLSHFSKIG